jgi:hypothetical protein
MLLSHLPTDQKPCLLLTLPIKTMLPSSVRSTPLKRKPIEGDSGEELGDNLSKSGAKKYRSMVMKKFLLGLAKVARKK